MTLQQSSLKETIEVTNKASAEMRLEMDGLEKERDFYFDKLREIEMMLQDLEDNGNGTELTASIFKVLYATAEGFAEPVEDAGSNAPQDIDDDSTDVEVVVESSAAFENLEVGVVVDAETF